MNGGCFLRNILNKASVGYPNGFKIEIMGNLIGAMESLQIVQDYHHLVMVCVGQSLNALPETLNERYY